MQKLLLVYYHSENRGTCQIWRILPNMFFSPIWGEKWRRPEHAHASYPGLFFRPPGFSPYMGREERRVQGLDYLPQCAIGWDYQHLNWTTKPSRMIGLIKPMGLLLETATTNPTFSDWWSVVWTSGWSGYGLPSWPPNGTYVQNWTQVLFTCYFIYGRVI